jgi:predicted transcriptional regulator
MLISDLLELGFTDPEARVYRALLELGGSYVSAIAKKAEINRVVCYKILDQLVSKGLISQFTKDDVRHYIAEDPRILVRHQQKKLEKVEKLLPEMLSMTHALVFKPKVQYYEGVEGLRTVLDDTLTAQGEILGYTDFGALPKVLPEAELIAYAQQKIEKRIKTRCIAPQSNEALTHLGHCYPQGFHSFLLEVLFVDPKDALFEYQILIYNDRVAVLSLNPSELVAMIIESPVYARTQRAILQLAWKGVTPSPFRGSVSLCCV